MPYENITATVNWNDPEIIDAVATITAPYIDAARTIAVTDAYRYVDESDLNTRTIIDMSNAEISILKNRVSRLEEILNCKANIDEILEYVSILEKKVAELDKIVNWQKLMLVDEEDDSWQ